MGAHLPYRAYACHSSGQILRASWVGAGIQPTARMVPPQKGSRILYVQFADDSEPLSVLLHATRVIGTRVPSQDLMPSQDAIRVMMRALNISDRIKSMPGEEISELLEQMRGSKHRCSELHMPHSNAWRSAP